MPVNSDNTELVSLFEIMAPAPDGTDFDGKIR